METALIITSLILLWALLSCLYGFGEAYYYYHLQQAADKRGRLYDHAFLSLIRIITAIPFLSLIFVITESYAILALSLLVFVSIFPFLHDGFYFTQRNNFVKGTYPDGWRSNVDGRAHFDLKYSQRVALFYFSLAATILIILLSFG